MKVRELKKALEKVDDDLDVLLDALDHKEIDADAFEIKKAAVEGETGIWNEHFNIVIGRGFRY